MTGLHLYLSVAWRLFTGQSDRHGWGCWFAAVAVMLAVCTGAALLMFGTPPYALEDIGIAALAVLIVGGGFRLLLGLMFGFGVGDTIKNVQDHARWQREDNPPPPPPSGSRIALHRRARTQKTRKGG